MSKKTYLDKLAKMRQTARLSKYHDMTVWLFRVEAHQTISELV